MDILKENGWETLALQKDSDPSLRVGTCINPSRGEVERTPRARRNRRAAADRARSSCGWAAVFLQRTMGCSVSLSSRIPVLIKSHQQQVSVTGSPRPCLRGSIWATRLGAGSLEQCSSLEEEASH
jgi:hypothetical protein